MNIKINHINEMAQTIYKSGSRGHLAWVRLKVYLFQFDNVDVVFNQTSIFINQKYIPLTNIINSNFFIEKSKNENYEY